MSKRNTPAAKHARRVARAKRTLNAPPIAGKVVRKDRNKYNVDGTLRWPSRTAPNTYWKWLSDL